MDPTTSSHNAAMSTSETPSLEPNTINLNEHEKFVINSIRKGPYGACSCKLCGAQSNNIMWLITHLLTFCDDGKSLTTFSTKSAIQICMALDEPGSAEMLQRYIRVASRLATEVSDLDDDSDSEVSNPEDFNHEQDDELVNENVKVNEPVGERRRAPKNQEFPVTPPASLSAEKKAEWTFKRDRLGEIRRIRKTHLQPNGNVDQHAALAAWNSSSRPSTWAPNAANARPYATYKSLGTSASNNSKRLRVLAAEAEEAEKAQKQQ